MKPRKCTANELPAYRHREELLATVRAARVTLVRGATGCGKSTQLPRLLLLEAAAAGTPCAIVVAQPRRLAAMALAERVASELGEGVGGLSLDRQAAENLFVLGIFSQAFCAAGYGVGAQDISKRYASLVYGNLVRPPLELHRV